MRFLSPILLLLASLCLSCSTPSPTPLQGKELTQQSANPKLPGYVAKRGKKAPYALVLVHGITGDGRTSWTNRDGAYWPKLMEGDPAFKDFDIYVHEYPTSLFGGCMAVSDLATTMHAHLKSDGVFENHESVIFLAHSMGGLVVRTFLLRYRENADKVPMVIFMATPSAGSWKANVGSLLPTCPQVEDLRTLDVNSFLKTQQSDWLNANFKDRIVSYCAIETKNSGGSLTVDRSSASLLCTREPLPLPADHSDVVKPNGTDDLPHKFLKNALSDLLAVQQRRLATTLSTTEVQTAREESKKADNNRRKQMLQSLVREYILSHDGLSPGLLAGTEWPPIDWLNKRVKELGESWTVAPGQNPMELRFLERDSASNIGGDSNPILQWGTSAPGTNSTYVIVNTGALKQYAQDYRLIVLYRGNDSFTEARDDTRVAKSDVFEITGERKTITTRLGQDLPPEN